MTKPLLVSSSTLGLSEGSSPATSPTHWVTRSLLPSNVLYANAIARDDSSDSTTDGARGVGSGTDLREREFARNSLRVDSEEVVERK